MPFDWNDFLSLAEELAQRVDNAARRSAISRAYYSAFNQAYARAEATAGPRPNDQPFHSWCWRTYTSTQDARCRRIGIEGERIKRLRVKADYDRSDNPRIEDEVRRALEEARRYPAILTALDPRHPRP